MSRYKLRANYDIENIDSQKMDGTVIVDVPMLSNGELNYGLSHIKKKLYEENVYPSEIGFDIMSLATMVYMADTRIERVVHGQDSWTREIELEIPVSNVEIWDSQIRTVERMLKFLTGDLWKITLSSRAWQFNNLEEVREKSNKYDEVSLFSGGMDSLISTINLMENKKNTLLISHAGEGLTKNAQKNIVNKFDLLYPDVLHTWLDLWMVFPRDYIPAGGMQLFKSLIEKSHYIGEVGLDFSKGYIQTKELQINIFSKIVKLCEQYSEKVISIHSLKSTSTVIEILRTYKRQKSNKYIFHWFTGSMPQLEKAIELGCYFSINPGMLKTKSGMEVIKAIPIDHVLLETDAPFALKVQHIDEIEKELKRTMSRISDVIGFDISDIINKNSKEVFCY